MNIEELNKSFSKIFRLENTKTKDEYIMYLDNNILGMPYKLEHGFTSYEEDDYIRTHCNLSDIEHLTLNDIPENVKFSFVNNHFGEVDDREAAINNQFTLPFIQRKNNQLMLEFWFRLKLSDYEGDRNPIKFVNDFYKYLLSLDNCTCLYNEIEEEDKIVSFVYNTHIQGNNISVKTHAEKVIKTILDEYTKLEKIFFTNSFESIFNFPKEYQSILKPYLLYFEEFLHDLCIETDVNIQVVGEETILSVVPKDKNEALDKIADALKAYLCAPVVSNGVSMEESLQMQTTVTKLYAQCKHLESLMMYKELTLTEQNKHIDLKDNIINESKRILIESGVDTNIITQNNTMLLESLKCIKIDGESIEKKPFISSIKGRFKIPLLFKTNFEINRSK